MKRLFTIDRKDYDESWAHSKRPSIRAVIFKGDKLAMVYSVRDKYYKFPGGGMEEHEGHHSTLIREVREEVGLNVIPFSIKEFGEVVVLRKSDIFENTVFEQESFYYFCDTEEAAGDQRLDDYEADAGFELRYVTIEEALAVNAQNTIPKHIDMLNRECSVLRLLSEQNQ